MFIGLLSVIGSVYYASWFLWPFLFMGAAVYAIRHALREEGRFNVYIPLAGLCLLVILAGLSFPVV